jgi:hypothetical protein
LRAAAAAGPEDNSSSKGMTEECCRNYVSGLGIDVKKFFRVQSSDTISSGCIATPNMIVYNTNKNPNFKGGGDVLSVEKANCGDVGAG